MRVSISKVAHVFFIQSVHGCSSPSENVPLVSIISTISLPTEKPETDVTKDGINVFSKLLKKGAPAK